MTPRADISEERRTQIIQAARACFARQGYHRTTMDDIVRESGLSKGTLYWYFSSKEELFLAILDAWWRDLAQAIQKPASDAASTVERLTAWVDALTRFIQAGLDRVRLIMEFWAEVHRSHEIERKLGQIYRERARLLADIIQQGVDRGEFRTVDPYTTAQTFLAAYDGLLLQQVLLPDRFSWDEVNRLVIDTLLHGLLAYRPGGRDAVVF
ncbi:MAG: TetR/AcrR family transcriptional regulator [Anaerolineae bacterium]|nr:TetR/AcrR family transcriptional regulator [Anaerolineae bacterium]MDW8100237.1 TetR/AcrR family transcriptional regulator [Anaerolineae bacterium]